jgi:hypothetical protein
MTNSRSRASRSRFLGVVGVVVVLCAIAGGSGVAEAGRKRVVVLDFEGPKADKFHDDLVKLIKKTHTVVPTDKWNGTAEELDAGTVSDKNIKKVAKKLKIDAVVEGKIEKRRDEFIIRIKLYAGRSGELVGNSIDTKADGPQIDGKAQRDLKDELVGAIDNVESNHLGGGGGDEDEDKPAVKKAAKKTDEEDEDKPAVKKAAKKTDEEDEDKPVKKGFSKRADEERGGDKVDKKAAKKTDEDEDKLPPKKAAKKTDEDEDKLPPKKAAKKTDEDEDKLPPKKLAKASKPDGEDSAGDGDGKRREPKKKVASGGDDDGSAEVDVEAATPVDAETALSPGERALDAVLGLSVTARRMSFTSTAALVSKPPGYKGTPVAGAMIDATFYPLAFGHKRTDMLKNIGLSVMYDRVLKINSKDAAGKVYATTEARFGVGAAFRYAFNKTASAPVVIGSLGYSSQAFTITAGAGGAIDIPNVKYSIFEPGAGLRYPATPKIIVGVDAKVMFVTSTGPIQDPMQYGGSSVFGFEGAASVDYLITRNIFARAAFKFETIGMTFNGKGTMTNARDGNPMTQDVSGARDNYIGGVVTAGYLY